MSSSPSPTVLDEARATCADLLPRVSRTFALTIPLLQEPLHSYVGIAYLLCRIADTIEDRPGQLQRDRDRSLRRFAEAVREPGVPLGPGDLGGTGIDAPGEAPYEHLVANVREVLACYRGFPGPVRNAITTCVEDMAGGMAEFSAPAAAGPAVEACADLEDLERYCHAVAGTVGLLLSDLFAQELSPAWLDATRAEEGRKFGLGLQLTNIIKDREGDGRRGITYIPPSWLSPGGGLTGEGTRILIERALQHLDQAQQFILSIPPSRPEMRLFCLWAAHLALATLRLTAHTRGRPAKVSRADLSVILETTRTQAANDAALQDLYLRGREEALAALPPR